MSRAKRRSKFEIDKLTADIRPGGIVEIARRDQHGERYRAQVLWCKRGRVRVQRFVPQRDGSVMTAPAETLMLGSIVRVMDGALLPGV